MAGNVLPPVRVTFTASVAAALKNLAKLADTLARLGESAKAAAEGFDVAMESMAKGAESLAAVADATKAVRTSMSGLSRATNNMAAATDKAAAAADKGMASIADAATAMAEKVDASTTAAAEGFGRLGLAAKEGATGVKVAADETRASSAAMAESGGAADVLGSKWLGLGAVTEKVAKFGSLGLIGIGVEAGRMASKFQTAMTQINTQAGVSQSAVKSLGGGVLNLAGQVGFSPDSLAEALFHVESSFASTGITGQKAMDILKVAAEGAKVGGANLVDVQNALDAAVASGISGVQDYSQAMGALNAIVGSGDMKMQDLANALGTGVLAVVKGYGVTLNDVGAALATFGDNNIRGAVAATDLRMAVQALSVPAKSADSDLKRFGMTNQTLADDMRTGGLSKALNDLIDRMRKAGVTADQQGQVITDMFGKKAGAGIAVLLGQIDRFNSKYPEEEKGAKGFANAWVTAQHTLSVQFDQIKAGFDSLMIRIGQKVIPATSALITLLESKGSPVVKKFSEALSGIGSGFTGQAGKTPVDAGAMNRHHGEGTVTPPPLMPWQKLGEMLRGVADNFKRFGEDCAKAFHSILQAAGPTLQLLGGALLLALRAVGQILANVVGPALVKVSGFLDHNKGVVRDLIAVALAPLALRLTALAVIKPIGAIAGLAKDIVMFPINQTKAIFGGIRSGIDSVSSAAGKIKDGFSKIPWDKISSGAKRAAQGVRDTFMKVPWGDMASGISKGFSKAWDGIGKGALRAQMAMSDFAGKAGSAISDGLVKAAEKAGGAWRGAQDLMVAGAEKAGAAWRGLKDVGSGLADLGSKGLEGIGKLATMSWSKLTGGLTAAKDAMKGFAESEKLAAAWAKITAVAEAALDAVMDANPIVLIVLAIVALVAAFVLAYQHSKTFRDIVQGALKAVGAVAMWLWKNAIEPAFKGIAAAVSMVVDWVKGHWPLLLALLTGPIGIAVLLIVKYWADIKRWFQDGVNFALSVVSWLGRLPGMLWGYFMAMNVKVGQGVIAAVRWFEQLPGMILRAVGDLGSLLYNAGVSIIEGLWNGIVSMGAWLGNAIMGLIKSVVPGPVLKILGINSPSKVFHEIGLNVMEGLRNGLTAGGPQVAQASANMANAVINHGTPSGLSIGASAAAAAANGQMAQVYVTVQLNRRVLYQEMQTEALRYGRRNPTTGLVYSGT